MELKTKMDFWDTLYAALFGVMFLMNITDVAWLLLIAVFLYTGFMCMNESYRTRKLFSETPFARDF